MKDDDQIAVREGGSKKKWLWTILGVALAVVVLFVLIGFSAMLIKWGIIAMLVYGAFAIARRLLTKSSGEDSSATSLFPSGDSQPDVLALLEQDRDLDELKARMNDTSNQP
jgi:flagellar basal body-associated protein FliL